MGLARVIRKETYRNKKPSDCDSNNPDYLPLNNTITICNRLKLFSQYFIQKSLPTISVIGNRGKPEATNQFTSTKVISF